MNNVNLFQTIYIWLMVMVMMMLLLLPAPGLLAYSFSLHSFIHPPSPSHYFLPNIHI